ncbi:MAG: hypothetical protein KatS3mg076_2797 [Candidatus Binatia bacterium]|nr:MAG: hypothetical protein KatS3mg076_2797 [Candidatus Binatia bacterium]
MKGTSRLWLRAVVVVVSVASVSACTTTVRKHPGFEERRKELRSVAVMPPEVEIVRVVFRGDNEELREEAEAVSQRLAELLEAELRRRGFEVKPVRLAEPELSQDADLRFELTQIRATFAEKSAEMFQVGRMSKSEALAYEASLGPSVNRFADRAGVDALCFVRMAGWKKSGGEIARDWTMTLLLGAATAGGLVRVPHAKGAGIEVALVDGTTGDVLWANAAGKYGDFEGKGLESMVEDLFEGFPK